MSQIIFFFRKRRLCPSHSTWILKVEFSSGASKCIALFISTAFSNSNLIFSPCRTTEIQTSGPAVGGKKGRRFDRGIANLGEMPFEFFSAFAKQVLRILAVNVLQPVFGFLFVNSHKAKGIKFPTGPSRGAMAAKIDFEPLSI